MACAPTAEDGERPREGRRFTYSSNPDDEIVSVLYSGGLSTMDVSIRLFGDGSLRAEERRSLDGVVRASWKAQLSAEQVEGILRDAVDNGLMEYDERQVRAQKVALKRREPSGTDMPGSFVEIHLVSLEDENGALSGPISRRIAAMHAQRSATVYPEIAELGALARLLNAFSTQFLAMKGVVKP